ncbi:MAG TPA: hypothetical protein PK307_14370 [Spirochaetota bacterium]|nr:hypothetical protein [Spirochaetota bacterium]HOD14677.1 hypothetical protein [Spirochaetota bacterium]HPG49152.1 hypothetical protein [Spirochaetota bacterium]HPN13819.1 hypothetical protein [Spirochaetota bacterium]HQL83385.1 hypothetical protein [Spirochaetota bacterium]
MKGTVSFAPLEKELRHEMRNTINRVEDTIDLENRFSNIMKQLLEKACERQHIPIDIDIDDVIFNPEAGNYYVLSKKLKKMTGFSDLWDSSDLKNVIGRFADSAHRKYLHLHRHPEKARFKIR